MSIKVLVADDSITIQKVIGIILGGDEYSLTIVDNGKTALDKAVEIIPDILLIDALMPGMTGYEVSEAVRSTPAIASKPILILTGSFEPFDEEKAKKCGADDFIAKPFESQQIITKIKELLEIGKTRELKPQAPAQTPIVAPIAAPISAPIVEQVIASAFEPVAEPIFEKTPEIASTKSETNISAPQQIEQPAAPTDIWGAFTTEAEPLVAPTPAVSTVAAEKTPEDTTTEPDVFAIVTEENDAAIIQNAAPIPQAQSNTGSQWVPVEENTFEFEETIAAPPQSTFASETPTIAEPSFGDISFEEETFSSTTDVNVSTTAESIIVSPVQDFADFVAPSTPAEPFVPLADPVPSFATPETVAKIITPSNTESAIAEEQLKAALASASKEVIERIVWEVVPDLAEAMIREAIRKIKEGI